MPFFVIIVIYKIYNINILYHSTSFVKRIRTQIIFLRVDIQKCSKMPAGRRGKARKKSGAWVRHSVFSVWRA